MDEGSQEWGGRSILDIKNSRCNGISHATSLPVRRSQNYAHCGILIGHIPKGKPLSLRNLCELVKHYWRLVGFLSIASALAIMLVYVAVVPNKYEATSSVTVSDPSGNVSSASMLAVVSSLAQSETEQYNTENSTVSVTLQPSVTGRPQTFGITVESSSQDECVALSNSIASSVAEGATELFAGLQEANEGSLSSLNALTDADDAAAVLSGSLLQDVLGSSRTFEFCSFMVNESVEAQSVSVGMVSLALLSLLCGLFIAVFVVVIIDAIKMPVRNRQDVEDALGAPVLCDGDFDENWGERLWANIQFVTCTSIESLCVIPSGEAASADECSAALRSAIQASEKRDVVIQKDTRLESSDDASSESICIYECTPLDSSVWAAYCAHDASATIVCVRMWGDGRRSLRETMRQLSLAKANVVGAALLS